MPRRTAENDPSVTHSSHERWLADKELLLADEAKRPEVIEPSLLKASLLNKITGWNFERERGLLR